nr:Dam family site-specific DNA-(adenine-N6)-methyltransferase [Rickettsia conorii]
MFAKHKANHSQDYYYAVRKNANSDNPIEIATRFIYLNKTCYNGLYRVNSKGECNVPMGAYMNPNILDKDNILACSKALQNAEIIYQDFSNISPKPQDFVYIDPPYQPINNTSFTKYTKLGFTEADQVKLYEKCRALNKKGVYFISNSDSDFILYHPERHPNCLVIESKWQQSGGSVDEKYTDLVLNIKKQGIYDTIIIIDGDGYKKEALKCFKDQVGSNLIEVFSMSEFTSWVNKKKI